MLLVVSSSNMITTGNNIQINQSDLRDKFRVYAYKFRLTKRVWCSDTHHFPLILGMTYWKG